MHPQTGIDFTRFDLSWPKSLYCISADRQTGSGVAGRSGPVRETDMQNTGCGGYNAADAIILHFSPWNY